MSASRTPLGRNRPRRNCPISAPAQAAARRAIPSTARRGRSRGRSCSPSTPSAETTAPAVSPPATMMLSRAARDEPRGDSAQRLLHHRAGRARGRSAAAPPPLLPARRSCRSAPACLPAARSAQAIASSRDRLAGGDPVRIELQVRPELLRMLDLPARRGRAASGEHHRPPLRPPAANGAAAAPSSPARRKFSGSPSATPEPPVTSAWPAIASPIVARWRSESASTTP